jgi:hypothetical protein
METGAASRREKLLKLPLWVQALHVLLISQQDVAVLSTRLTAEQVSTTIMIDPEKSLMESRMES